MIGPRKMRETSIKSRKYIFLHTSELKHVFPIIIHEYEIYTSKTKDDDLDLTDDLRKMAPTRKCVIDHRKRLLSVKCKHPDRSMND